MRCGVAVVIRAFRAGKKGGRSAHWGGGWCSNFPKLVTSCLVSKFVFSPDIVTPFCYRDYQVSVPFSHTYTHTYAHMSITKDHEYKARSHTVDSFHPESSWPIEALLLHCNWRVFLSENSVFGRAWEPESSGDDVDDHRQCACGRESKHENEPACLASYDRRSSRPRHFLCVCLCVSVRVPRATRSPPPTALSAQPPGSWVSLGMIWGRRG